MLLTNLTKESLNSFFQSINLVDYKNEAGKDKEAKIEQILAYLEMIHAIIRNYSRKRELVFIDCGAGNCYLSYLVYYFYTHFDYRKVRIYCIDTNETLMSKNRQLAANLGFDKMFYTAGDIFDYTFDGRPDMVYSLHACDTATDKALYLGCKTNARNILSVSCCQHTIKKQLRSGALGGITRHRVFKDRLTYLLGDTQRSLLLNMQGYEVSVVDFISSRYTDKNVMIRAKKGQVNNLDHIQNEYNAIVETFRIRPALETYLYPELQMILSKHKEVA